MWLVFLSVFFLVLDDQMEQLRQKLGALNLNPCEALPIEELQVQMKELCKFCLFRYKFFKF